MKTFVTLLVIAAAALVLYAIVSGLPADVLSPFHTPEP